MPNTSRSDEALVGGKAYLSNLVLEGWTEFINGIRSWRISHLMGSAEIRRRYARSKLGQAWLVVSTALTVAMLGWLWSTLWRTPYHEMVLYAGVSYVFWQFVSGVIADCSNAFVTYAHYFLNQHVSASTIVNAVIYRHVLLLAHNLPLLILLAVFFGEGLNWTLLTLIPSAVLVILISYWLGYLLAAASARYRDLTQIIALMLQFALFITPIMWRVEQLPPEARHYVVMNPLHYVLEALRAPFLHTISSSPTYIGLTVFAIGGFVATLPIIGWLRNRIVFWL